MCGVYPAADAREVGAEISSTYEGRHLTLYESEITHPPGGDGFVDKGDACVIGAHGVGVALASAAAITDLIAIDTEGIWVQDVNAVDDAGNSQVNPGDLLYINTTTCVLSKINNLATQIPFGYALGTVVAGNTDTIAVKVHYDPSVDNERQLYHTVPTGTVSKALRTILTDGQSEGLNGYVEGHIAGTTVGHIYGKGSWINVDPGAVLSAGHIITPREGGIWTGEAQAAARIVFAGQYQAILNGAPASLHAWRLNSTQTIDALIAAANPGSVGYDAGKAGTGVIGTIPLADVVGTGIVFVDVHGAVA